MEEKHERQKHIAALVSMGFEMIMVVLYVILGTTIIFNAVFIPNAPPLYLQVFGTILIAYGIFRGYKVYRKYFPGSES